MDGTLESGTVIELVGDQALIRLTPSTSCDHCAAKIICRPNETGDRVTLALNTLGAKQGEQVEVAEMDNFLLKLSILQYGLPLLGLLVGVFTVYLLNFNPFPIAFELTMTLSGVLGVVIAGGVSSKLASAFAQKMKSAFEIVSISPLK